MKSGAYTVHEESFYSLTPEQCAVLLRNAFERAKQQAGEDFANAMQLTPGLREAFLKILNSPTD